MIDGNTDFVQVANKDGVMHILLNRPERKNALTLAMYQKLANSIASAREDRTVRVILISGAEGCFTSGNDLQDFVTHKGDLGDENPTPKFMRELMFCDKPVVAAVQGPAVGIGTTMLLHCDLVYAAESAFLQMPFSKLGVCPEFASSYVLPRLMGHQRAAELLLFGDPISPAKALNYGIVNEVFADEELMGQVFKKCQQLTQLPASSLRATKQLMKRDVREQAPVIMDVEREYFGRGLKSPEFAEAAAAFKEKRQPDFSKFD